ncbi:MAG: amidohydrolase family protein [Haloferacaceae archaeon]
MASADSQGSADLHAELTTYDCEVHTYDTFPRVVEYVDDETVRENEKAGYTIGPDEWGPLPWDGWDRRAHGRIQQDTLKIQCAEDYDPKLEEFGIDRVVFSPGLGFKTFQIPDDNTRATFMRAMNDYIVDQFVREDDVHFAKMLIVPDLPQESAREIDRVAGTDGIVGIFSADLLDYPLGHDRYAPVLEAVERAGLPLFLHSDSSVYAGFPTGDFQFGTFLEHHALVHPFLKLWHATSVILQGVPERYDIDICFMEAGQSWIQMLANRLDREYVERPHDAPELTKLPSEYLSEFYYTTQPLEESKEPGQLAELVERYDLEDQLCFTGDYPHYDFDAPSAVLDHPHLSDHLKTKILQDNPRELLGI